MKLASYHLFGDWTFGVAFRFLEYFCTPCYNVTDFLVGVGTVRLCVWIVLQTLRGFFLSVFKANCLLSSSC